MSQAKGWLLVAATFTVYCTYYGYTTGDQLAWAFAFACVGWTGFETINAAMN